MTTDASKISSNVLDMKFMRRTKQRLEEKEKRQQESTLQKAYLAGESAKSIGGSSSSRFIFTKDLEFLEDLQYGRMSFKGCNPAVEKLMKYFTDKKNGAVKDSDDEKDISDGEMAENLGSSRSRQGVLKRKSMDEGLIDESSGNGKMRRVENNGYC